jgi:hypothetical protein
MDFAGFNQTVNHSAGIGSVNTIGKHPVLSANRKRSDGSLYAVIVDFKPSVLKIWRITSFISAYSTISDRLTITY